jgi:hypothetical protein
MIFKLIDNIVFFKDYIDFYNCFLCLNYITKFTHINIIFKILYNEFRIRYIKTTSAEL